MPLYFLLICCLDLFAGIPRLATSSTNPTPSTSTTTPSSGSSTNPNSLHAPPTTLYPCNSASYSASTKAPPTKPVQISSCTSTSTKPSCPPSTPPSLYSAASNSTSRSERAGSISTSPSPPLKPSSHASFSPWMTWCVTSTLGGWNSAPSPSRA